MRVINVSLNELETKLLMIGFEGENQITQVRIDAAEILTDHPNATPTLIVKPLFGFAYPVIVTQEGTDVVWEIDNSVLSSHGDGEIQLTFTAGTVIAKSYVGRIRIKRSLAVNGEKPDPIETWEQAATAKLAEVDAQIDELEDMVEAAEAAKDQAQDIVDDAAADIQAAGEEVLDSIPSDYTALSDDVTVLKSAINDMSTATAEDAGKALKAKTVSGGKVVEWEFGDAGSDDVVIISDTEPTKTENKIWIDSTPPSPVLVPTFEEHTEIKNEVKSKVNKPSSDGIQGQLLQTNGDGTTKWVNSGTPSSAQVDAAVEAWLSEHPVSALDASTASNGQVPTADGDGDWSWMDSNSQDATRIDVSKFGGYSDGTHAEETEQALNNALASAKENGYSKAYLPAGIYLIRGYDPNASDNIGRNAGVMPPSDMHFVLASDAVIKIEPNSKVEYNAFYLKNKNNVIIEGGKIVGDRPEHNYSLIESSHEWGAGMRLRACHNCVIKNVEFYDFTGDCISFGNDGTYGNEDYDPTTNLKILYCNLHAARRNGISISGSENTLVYGCHIHEIGIEIDGIAGTAPRVGIDIEGYSSGQTITSVPYGVTISNCYFNNNNNDINMFTADKAVVIGNHFTTSVAVSYAYESVVTGNVFHGDGTNTAVTFISSKQSKNYESICHVVGNLINGYAGGINVKGGYVSIQDNLVINCADYGVLTYSQGVLSNNLVISNNMVAKCSVGIKLHGATHVVITANTIMSTVNPFSWYVGGANEAYIVNNVIDTFSDKLINLKRKEGSDNKLQFANNIIANCVYSGSTEIFSIAESFKADIIGNYFFNISAPRVIGILNDSSYVSGGEINIEKNYFKNCAGITIYAENSHTPIIRIIRNTIYVLSGNSPVINMLCNSNTSCSLITENLLLPENEEVARATAIKTSDGGMGTILKNIIMIGIIDALATDKVIDNYIAE